MPSFTSNAFFPVTGTNRKPTTLNTTMLVEDLQNAPKTRKRNDSEQGRQQHAGDQQGQQRKYHPACKETLPNLDAEVEFTLDDKRMKRAYRQKASQADCQSL
jgi:hypothetical protein